jgi:predicted dehydrogenase
MPTDPTRREFMTTASAGALAAAAAAAGAAGAAGAATAPATTQLAPPDKQRPNLNVPRPQDKPVGWAIVGLGQLALGEVMPAFRETKLSRPVALVSGHPDKAKQVAAFYGMDAKQIYNYENYDAIRDNPDVQAVYVILPNSMHAEYTIRAHRAGKHVLCEKPMAANVRECEEMIAAARAAQKKLMVAYRLRYEPFNKAAIEILRKRQLGEIILIDTHNVQNQRAPNIRLSKQLAGGPLGDIGVYCINACRYLTGEEPQEVTAQSYQPKDEARFAEVPRDYVFTMSFPSGAHASCAVSFGSSGSRHYRVLCADGYLDMTRPYGYRGQELRTYREQKETRHDLNSVNHFAAQMDHFSECILNNTDPLTPGEEGLRDHRVMAAIEEAAANGRRVKV